MVQTLGIYFNPLWKYLKKKNAFRSSNPSIWISVSVEPPTRFQLEFLGHLFMPFVCSVVSSCFCSLSYILKNKTPTYYPCLPSFQDSRTNAIPQPHSSSLEEADRIGTGRLVWGRLVPNCCMQCFHDELETDERRISETAPVSAQCQQLLLSQQSNGVCLGWKEGKLLKLFSIPSETNKCYSSAWHNWVWRQIKP